MANANGIGYTGGNDTVLTNFYGGIMNTFNREQAKVQARQAAEAKQLQDDQKQLGELVKKVNIAGVQKQHLPEITKKLDGIYETYYKANKSESQQERLALRLDLEKSLTELGQEVATSKQFGQGYAKVAEQMATKPQLFSQQARQQFQQNFNKPLSQLAGNETNLQTYISPDTSLMVKTEDDMVKRLWSRASENTSYGKTIGVGVMGDKVTQTTKTKQINPADIGAEIFRIYNSDNGYKNLIDYEAGQVGMTPQNYLVERSNKIAELNKPITEQGQFRNSRPSSSGGSGSGDSKKAETYRQQQIQGIFDGDQQSIEELLAYLPQGSKVVPSVSRATGNSKGGYKLIRINIPDIEKPDGTFISGVKNLDISFSKGDAANQINNIINKYSGEVIKPSKLNIRGGKPAGQQIEIRGVPRTSTPPKQTAPKSTGKKVIKGW